MVRRTWLLNGRARLIISKHAEMEKGLLFQQALLFDVAALALSPKWFPADREARPNGKEEPRGPSRVAYEKHCAFFPLKEWCVNIQHETPPTSAASVATAVPHSAEQHETTRPLNRRHTACLDAQSPEGTAPVLRGQRIYTLGCQQVPAPISLRPE